MHDVPGFDFVFSIFLLTIVVFAFWAGHSRAKRLHERIDAEIAKRHKTEDEYHELMLHTISCRMMMWRHNVELPDLPPHLSKHKNPPRGLVN